MAIASERAMVFSYPTSIAPVGPLELESWSTLRAGRERYMVRFDQRLELETGLASWLQGALYFNWKASAEALPAGSEGAPGLAQSGSFRGLSMEFKANLLNAALAPLGLALLVEPSFKLDEAELELLLLVDKELGSLSLSANLGAEWAYELGPLPAGSEALSLKLLLSGGAVYALSKGVSLGIEAQLSSSGAGSSVQRLRLNAGPTLSYQGEAFWLSFGVAPQWVALKGATPGRRLDLESGEKLLARLLLGIHLG